mgnify:CR=1 FL=1
MGRTPPTFNLHLNSSLAVRKNEKDYVKVSNFSQNTHPMEMIEGLVWYKVS